MLILLSISSQTDLNRKSLKRPDGFTSTVRGFFDSLAERWRVVLGLIGLLVIGGIGVGLLSNQRDAQLNKARNAFFLAKQSVNKDLEALLPAPKIEPSALPQSPDIQSIAFKKLDVDRQIPEGVKKLKAVVSDFQKTRAGLEAQLTLGDLYMNHGEPLKALPWFEGAVKVAKEPFDRALALISLGYAFENAGQLGDALKNFEAALNLGEDGVQGDALMGQARAYQGLKDTIKAKATYDKIISQLPDSAFARTAETLKARLE